MFKPPLILDVYGKGEIDHTVFTAALFTVAQKWEQHRSPSADNE